MKIVPKLGHPKEFSIFFRLSNQIPILCINDTFDHSVFISWFINCGSLYDPIDRLGLAHFVEHMLFKGTKKHPSPMQLNQLIDKYGAYSNAHTSQERTWYDLHIDSRHWTKGLEIMGEMMFDSVFPENQFEPEKEVVVQEILLDQKTPRDVLEIDSNAWVWSNTPYARPVGGSPDTIRSIQLTDVLRFLGQYYQPHRMFLVIIGDLPSPKKTEKMVRKLLDRKWNQTVLGRAYEKLGMLGVASTSATSIMNQPDWWFIEKNKPNTYQTLYRIGDEPKLMNASIEHPGYPGPAIQWIPNELAQEQVFIKMDFPILDTNDIRMMNFALWLQCYLTDGMGSTLFVELREKEGLVYSITSRFEPVLNVGVGTFSIITATSQKNLLQVIQIISKELQKLKKQKIKKSVVDFYRGMAEGKQRLSFEDPSQWIWLAADDYFREGLIPGDVKKNIWEYTSPSTIRALSKKWFHSKTCWTTFVSRKQPSLKKIYQILSK